MVVRQLRRTLSFANIIDRKETPRNSSFRDPKSVLLFTDGEILTIIQQPQPVVYRNFDYRDQNTIDESVPEFANQYQYQK